jgi:crotonobetainyl-CoA hydratase
VPIHIDHRENIRTITIDRPEVRNALDGPHHAALAEALVEADLDPTARCIILTGAGEHAFCAGADLKARAQGHRLVPRSLPQGAPGLVLSTPLLVALNGSAHGLGAELVLLSDLVVMDRRAVIGFPEVRRGLIAAGGGAHRLGRTVPHRVAMRWLLTGDPITAEEALRWGVVNELAEGDGVMEAATALAETIASMGRGLRGEEIICWHVAVTWSALAERWASRDPMRAPGVQPQSTPVVVAALGTR